jgi:hypothetical protein
MPRAVINAWCVFVTVIFASASARAQITFCNKFHQPVFFAITYKQPGGLWMSQGWLQVAVDACRSFDRAPQISTFYWRAESDWYKNASGQQVWTAWHKPDGKFAVGKYPFATFTFEQADQQKTNGRLEDFRKCPVSSAPGGNLALRLTIGADKIDYTPLPSSSDWSSEALSHNETLSLGELIETGEERSSASECERVVGDWSWGGIANVVVDRSGSLFVKDNPVVPQTAVVGHWTCNSTSRWYVMSWNNGFIDSLELSDDGNSLTGTNQKSFPVWAKRIEQGSSSATPEGETPSNATPEGGFPLRLEPRSNPLMPHGGKGRMAP